MADRAGDPRNGCWAGRPGCDRCAGRLSSARPSATWGRRYTDCEWDLPDGRVVVPEVDGALHMDVEHWAADMARERELVIGGRIVLRCTAREQRENPSRIVRDLIALGVTRLYA